MCSYARTSCAMCESATVSPRWTVGRSVRTRTGCPGSAAARMIGAGWQAKAVQQTLGHSSVAFTLTVYGHLFDESDRFERFDAVTQTYAAQELGFGPDLSDAVVTWQTRPPRATPRPNASRKIAVRANGTRAVLVD